MHSKSAPPLAWLAGLVLFTGQAPAGAAQVRAQPSVDYDLPPQDLDERLRSIARLSGREILFAPETVRGVTAAALKGRLTLSDALRASLDGTTLVVEERSGAILVRPPAGPGAFDPSAIKVTGTRIRGAGSTSAVVVLTRKSLEEAGVSDLAGLTRILSQNFTGGQNPGIAGGGQQGGQSNVNNSAALNLRGLGPDATLTLVNGHRLAYDALEQGIDISAIPLAAVDRVEVIADGSSALYGSDAVGGVANVILRRDFSGLEVTARFGGSTDGGNSQQQFSLVAGGRWSSGGVMAALDHSRSTPIFADQRDYTRGLDPSLTLTLRNRQTSAVLTGRQQLAGALSLEFDGFVTDRSSLKQSPFLPNASVTVNGLVSRPHVRAYALNPVLRLELPSAWEASLSATRAVSRTRLDTMRYLAGTGSRSFLTYENSLSGVEANAEGPLFTAPGGIARLALGGGLRRVSLHDHITDIIAGVPVTFRDFTETRDVQFAYGELSLPLVGPGSSLPLLRRLSLSGAVRYERWKGIDAVATPKLGLIYQPARPLTLRATWGRSFKAPTLNQVNQAPQGVLLPGFLFAPQPQPPLAAGATVLLLGGGNPNLRSERATTWSATAELRPHLIDGLQLQASYFNVDYRDRIGSPLTGTLSALANPLFRDLVLLNPTPGQVSALIASFPQGLSNQTGQPFDPARVGAVIDGSLRNTARQHIHGIDLSADYESQLRGGQAIALSGSASYLESSQQLAPGQPVFDMAGTIFNPPHWRARAGASWRSPGAGLSAFLNYVGPNRDNRFPAAGRIGPFVTLDLSFSLRGPTGGALEGTELRLSANNLLNEKPDPILNSQPEAPPYDSTNQSPVGRFLGVSLRKAWR